MPTAARYAGTCALSGYARNAGDCAGCALLARRRNPIEQTVDNAPWNGEVRELSPISKHADTRHIASDRIRHGIRATEDTGLLSELADRGIVLDVCPISNLRTGVVRSLAEHPLPDLLAAGIQATINTDDPAMFRTDLSTEYATALRLGASAVQCYAAGVNGALCDESTRAEVRGIGKAFDWDAIGS